MTVSKASEQVITPDIAWYHELPLLHKMRIALSWDRVRYENMKQSGNESVQVWCDQMLERVQRGLTAVQLLKDQSVNFADWDEAVSVCRSLPQEIICQINVPDLFQVIGWVCDRDDDNTPERIAYYHWLNDYKSELAQ